MNLHRRILLSACAIAACAGLPAQAAERWNMSAEQPDGNYITAVAKGFAEDVAKATKGELEIKVHSNSVLFKRAELKRVLPSPRSDSARHVVFLVGPGLHADVRARPSN